jgi:hypothetical protein
LPLRNRFSRVKVLVVPPIDGPDQPALQQAPILTRSRASKYALDQSRQHLSIGWMELRLHGARRLALDYSAG